MLFPLYFLLSLLMIYVPLSTVLFLCQSLYLQVAPNVLFMELPLISLLVVDYFIGYRLLTGRQISRGNYCFWWFLNLVEFLLQGILLLQFQRIVLCTLVLFQLILLFCLTFFPCLKKFRLAVFQTLGQNSHRTFTS